MFVEKEVVLSIPSSSGRPTTVNVHPPDLSLAEVDAVMRS
jgi:hypothetical protein